MGTTERPGVACSLCQWPAVRVPNLSRQVKPCGMSPRTKRVWFQDFLVASASGPTASKSCDRYGFCCQASQRLNRIGPQRFRCAKYLTSEFTARDVTFSPQQHSNRRRVLAAKGRPLTRSNPSRKKSNSHSATMCWEQVRGSMRPLGRQLRRTTFWTVKSQIFFLNLS